MQVFKAFYKSLSRRITSVAMYVIGFAIISVIMAKTLTPEPINDFSSTKLKVAVFDYDNTKESHALYNYLADTQKMVSIKDDKEAIADELFFRNVDYVLIIPQGFSKNPDTLENVKQSGSISGYFLDNAIDSYLKLFFAYTSAGYSVSESAQLTADSIDTAEPAKLLTDETASDDNTIANIELFFHYLPYIFIAAIMTSLGGILLIFRKKDLNYRMKCSALSITRRNMELGAACITYSLLIWVIFMVMAAVLSGKALWSVNGLMLITNSFVFLLFAGGITYLISFLSSNDNIVNMWSNIIGLGMSFLCGIFIPLDYLSDGVQKIAHFLPAYWYIKADQLCVNYSGSAADLKLYFSYLGIQVLFAGAVFAAALVASKYKKGIS